MDTLLLLFLIPLAIAVLLFFIWFLLKQRNKDNAAEKIEKSIDNVLRVPLG